MAFGSDTLHADPKTELETLVQAGFTAEEALKMGTIQAAELLELETKIGTIETGKYADLIAVNGFPQVSVSDVAKIAAVMKGGDIYFSNEGQKQCAETHTI